jgi:hypothetical protein
MNHIECTVHIRSALWATGFSLLLVGVSACDPVVDDAVAALGGEAPGVQTGPLHRPGQPCLLCHDGTLGNPEEFSVAGTVFVDRTDRQAAQDAKIELKAADGTSHTLKANAAGNFYVTPQGWTPVYPLQVSVSYQGQKVSMVSNIGRNGACASCHVDPAGPASPGHVYAIPDDAGVQP